MSTSEREPESRGAKEAPLLPHIPDDLLFLMGGIAYSVQHSTREQARRLIDLIMDALTTNSAAL